MEHKRVTRSSMGFSGFSFHPLPRWRERVGTHNRLSTLLSFPVTPSHRYYSISTSRPTRNPATLMVGFGDLKGCLSLPTNARSPKVQLMWRRSRTVAPLASSPPHGGPLGTTRQPKTSAGIG